MNLNFREITKQRFAIPQRHDHFVKMLVCMPAREVLKVPYRWGCLLRSLSLVTLGFLMKRVVKETVIEVLALSPHQVREDIPSTIYMYLERLTGRKSKALEDLVNEALVVELKNGKVYGGILDEYYYDGGGVIALYSCKLLDKKNHKWIDHDIMTQSDGKLVADPMPSFWLAGVRDIFLLPKEHREKFFLDDALQTYIDPHYKPPTGTTCDWSPGEEQETKRHHAAECDARLHEALVFLFTMAELGVAPRSKNKNEYRRHAEAFACVRRRLLMHGARIP